jgi:hypothetical protein
VLSLALALAAARWGEAWVVGLAVPLLAWLVASLWQRQAAGLQCPGQPLQQP